MNKSIINPIKNPHRENLSFIKIKPKLAHWPSWHSVRLMVWVTRVRFIQKKSLCLTLSNIRYVSRVKWTRERSIALTYILVSLIREHFGRPRLRSPTIITKIKKIASGNESKLFSKKRQELNITEII